MSPIQPIAVAVVVWTDETAPDRQQGGPQNWVLVGRRAADVPLAGRWEFPGGKVQPEETPEIAAIRECREETGLAVQNVELLERRQHSYPHGTLDLSFYLCRVDGAGVQRPSARAPFRWLRLSDLAADEFPEANRIVIEQLTGRTHVD